MLKKVHRRAHPNDGFAKVLLDLDKKLYGKISMEWQHKRPANEGVSHLWQECWSQQQLTEAPPSEETQEDILWECG